MKFEGFYQKSTKILLEIRFNNNKEFFHSIKDEYASYVHEPMKLLAENLLEQIKMMDKDFDDEIKISRANRDIRFSKNKAPYKESKWFFFRKGNIATIEYQRPNYFFEITPDGYSYGLGFWPGPGGMSLLRSRSCNNSASDFEEALKAYKKQNAFELEGDMYKKVFFPALPEEKNNWLQRKSLTFIKSCGNDELLYSPELVDKVFNEIKAIHPVYKYLCKISE